MIRFALSLLILAIRWVSFVLLGLFVLGILPGPLLWWLAGEALRFAWVVFNTPILGTLAMGGLVGVVLAKQIHNAPLKAQRDAAMAKAAGDYERQRW